MAGQEDVLNALEKLGKPVSVRQIANFLGWKQVKVSMRIKPLVKHSEVAFEQLSQVEADERINGEYVVMRRTRFYFIAED